MMSDEDLRSACCDVLDRYCTDEGALQLAKMITSERYKICDLGLTGRTRISQLSGLEQSFLARRLSYLCSGDGQRVPFAIAVANRDTWWMSEDAAAAVAIEINEASGYMRLGRIDLPDWRPSGNDAAVCWQVSAASSHWGLEGVPFSLSVLDRLKPDQIAEIQRLRGVPRIAALLRALEGIPVPGEAIRDVGSAEATRRAREMTGKQPDVALLSWGTTPEREFCNEVCDALRLPRVGNAEYMLVRRAALEQLPEKLRVGAIAKYTH